MRRWMQATAVALFLIVVGSGPLLADWRHDTGVLRIGFLSAGDVAADVARLEPFRAWLQARLALPVELIPSTSYASLIDSEVSGRVQYSINSASSFATAEVMCKCVEPLAVPTAFDGSRGFHSLLVVRADGPIHTLADAKGARIALAAADDSVAGRLLPLQAFAALKIDPATYFAQTVAAPGPEAAIADLLSGSADVAAGWSSLAGNAATGYSFGVFTAMVAAGSLTMDRVRVIWQSPLIPFGPHAVRSDMAPELKQLLSAALADLAGQAPDILDAVDGSSYGGGAFAPAALGDYAAVEALVAPPGG